MWTRSDLKQRAKTVLHTCYWNAVLVSLILAVVTGASSGGGGSNGGSSNGSGSGSASISDFLSDPQMATLIAVIIGVVIVAGTIGLLIRIFVYAPVEVGAKRFFMVSREKKAELGMLGYGFKHSYGNIVKTQLLRAIFTFLWSLLFVIPGIIKGYEYRMIPYIMAENPDIDSKDAFRLSKEMMMGEKWNAFVLDISFIGWWLLCGCTCGILALFYVNPYVNLTNAELYAVLREKVLAAGESSTYELKGFAE